MPKGPSNREPVPVPSAKPYDKATPATVVTTPPGVTLRIVELASSETKTLPLESTATPSGA